MKKVCIYCLIALMLFTLCACSCIDTNKDTTTPASSKTMNIIDHPLMSNNFNTISHSNTIDINTLNWVTTTIKYYPQGQDNSVVTIDKYVEIDCLKSSYSLYLEPPIGFENFPVLDFTETIYITPMGLIIHTVGDVHDNYITSTNGFYPWSHLNKSLPPLPIDGYWSFE